MLDIYKQNICQAKSTNISKKSTKTIKQDSNTVPHKQGNKSPAINISAGQP